MSVVHLISYDFISCFGISHSELFDSVWYVVDAVNKTGGFDIKQPESQQEQKSIAATFKAVNEAEFKDCGGAIDGIFIWILKQSLQMPKL